MNQVFPQFYSTLKEKYGEPRNERIDSDEYLDMLLSNSLSRAEAGNPSRHLLTNSVVYIFSWNPWFGELPQDFIESKYISIFMRGGLRTDSSQNYIAETRTIRVNFINDELLIIRNKRRADKSSPKKLKEDSIQRLKKKFNDNL